MTSPIKVAKAWELAVISKVSDNGQYYVGGRDMLGHATQLVGLLAQQNQLPVQYDSLGENFEAAEGTCRTRVWLGDEEHHGGGNSAAEAQQAAALQALMKTWYIFSDMPAMLNPAPAKSEFEEEVETETAQDDTDSWQIYQYEHIEPNASESVSKSSGVQWYHSDSYENGSRDEQNGDMEDEDDMDDILCVATIWDFAGKIQVAHNLQYLVGGKESLKESKKLMGQLSRQNDIQVEYEAVDDELPLEEGQVMLKVIFGDESYFGSGDTVEGAKIAAALQVLLKTNYKFRDLPSELTPAPAYATAGKVLTEYPTELDGILAEKEHEGTGPDISKSKAETSQENNENKVKVAKNGQYYVDGETVERQSQYLISTMASQNKITHKYEMIEKCKSSAWVNWIAVRLILGNEIYNGSGESEAEAKMAVAMMALQKTRYRFKSQFLPAGLKPTPMQKSSELECLEQGIEKLRRVSEGSDSDQRRHSATYLEEMETEKEMALMLSGVDFDSGSGQFVINEYARNACKYLVARLASQNKFSVRYEVIGETFKPENKKCRVKLKLKSEEYIGHGPTIRRAKINASLKALRKTKFTFHSLPNYVKMIPGWNESAKTQTVTSGTNGEASDSNESDNEDKESNGNDSRVKNEPMEAGAQPFDNVKAKKRDILEEELEEGEIVSDDEDEDWEIQGPQKKTKLDDGYTIGRYDSKMSGRQLSLADLGLPTSFGK